ncbi:MAG: response regulator transcription factor [Chamaesiphon sp. CSU_1_12]|nr:response regulator transcription factor [Chamaesiphon sp. CSU_1_12]
MKDITVVLVEDHDVVRIGLRAVLQNHPGIKVLGEAATGTQGLKLLQTTPPDVAIVDIGLPGMDGIEMIRQFKEFQAAREEITTKTVVLTMQGSEEAVLAAFAAGADSYCMKDASMDRLVEAVTVTHSGHPWIDPAIANIVLRQMRRGMPVSKSEGQKTIEIKAVVFAARIALECIGNSDALYHNVEHTVMVTLVGQDILRGRRLRTDVPPEMWLHVILAALTHDIGYLRGVCRGDTDHRLLVFVALSLEQLNAQIAFQFGNSLGIIRQVRSNGFDLITLVVVLMLFLRSQSTIPHSLAQFARVHPIKTHSSRLIHPHGCMGSTTSPGSDPKTLDCPQA